MRDELEFKGNAIANLNSENKTLVGENKTLVADLLECRPALESVRDELKEREQAIAKLESELEVRENKQLTLFPGPEPTPEPTPEPEPIPTPNPTPEIVKPESTPEPKTKPKAKAKTKTKFPEGSLSTMELVARINQNFPDDGIVFNTINDCLTFKNGKPKSDKLSDYKAKYGFEFLGKFSGQRRFKLV